MISCTSSLKNAGRKQLDAVVSIPLGADKLAIIEKFGPPSKAESVGEIQAYIYSFPHNGQEIPKMTFWIDKNGRIVAKNVRLFKQDGDSMTQKDIETLFPSSKFKMRNSPAPKDGHFISAFKYMYDVQNGIEVEINTAQSNRASYIHWTSSHSEIMTSVDP
jgi:hypothetical protein